MLETEAPYTPRAKRRCLSSSSSDLCFFPEKQTFILSSSQVNNFIEEVRVAAEPNILDLQIVEANRYLANRAVLLAEEERLELAEEALEVERHRRNISIIEEVD